MSVSLYLIGKGVAGSIFTGFSPWTSALVLDPKLNQPLERQQCDNKV